jgi:DNA-binding response OmpR family regulator
MTKVLLISNDSTMEKMLNISLKFNGYIVHSTAFSDEAWKYLTEVHVDVVFVDVKLLDGSGYDFYRRMREKGLTLPVLMIGEGDFDSLMLTNFVSSQMNFLIKPFKFRELRKKVDTLMRTSQSSEKYLRLGEIKIDLRQHLIMAKDRMVHLGKAEMQILTMLARKTGEVVELPKYRMTSFYYISRLREKLSKLAGGQFEISFVGKEMYRLSYKS